MFKWKRVLAVDVSQGFYSSDRNIYNYVSDDGRFEISATHHPFKGYSSRYFELCDKSISGDHFTKRIWGASTISECKRYAEMLLNKEK